MVVFEGGAPKKSDYRRFTIRERRRPPTTSRRWRRSSSRRLRAVRAPARASRRTTPSATRRSPRCPNLIVIDGGKGQLAAGLRALQGFRERGVAVVSLAKRIEEVFMPGRAAPLVLAARHARAAAAPARARRGPPLRDHPPPHPPRQGDDRVDHRRAAAASARRASARCSSTSARPRRVLAASREELEAVPGRARRRSRATSTPTSPRRDETVARGSPPCPVPRENRSHERPALGRRSGRGRVGPESAATRRPRVISGLLRRRQVVGDERVRGRRLLLRRQPARRR